MIKNALKYTIAIVAFLAALALYFFFMMSKNLTHEEEIGSAGQKSHGQKSHGQENVAQKLVGTKDQQQCDVDLDNEALSKLKQDLSLARDEYSSCSASLSSSEQDVSELNAQLETMRLPQQDTQSELQAELQSAKDSVDTLQAKIAVLQEEKEQLLSSSSNDSSDEELTVIQSALAAKNSENRELSSTIKLLERKVADNEKMLRESQQRQLVESKLESELAQLNQEKIELLAKINQLEAAGDDSSTSISGPLAIVEFETLPVLCEQHRSAEQICVRSFEMVTKFNFRPNGFIALRLVDPNGDTIQRESIAAQEVNLFSFAFDDEIFAAGEYTVEVKIDDVFNQLNSKQVFTLSLPAELVNKLSSGQ